MEKITKALVNALTTQELIDLTNRQKPGATKAFMRHEIESWLQVFQERSLNAMTEIALAYLAGDCDSNTMKIATKNYKDDLDRKDEYWAGTEETENLERVIYKNPELQEKHPSLWHAIINELTKRSK